MAPYAPTLEHEVTVWLGKNEPDPLFRVGGRSLPILDMVFPAGQLGTPNAE